MSQDKNTMRQMFFSAVTIAEGCAVERTTNVVAGDEPAVILAVDPLIASNGGLGEPIIGIADTGFGAGGVFNTIVTEGRCFAQAGAAIAPTVRDLACDAAGLLIPKTALMQRVAINRHRTTVALNEMILVDVAITV